jgi:excisionase family DNA binding protein
MGKLAYRFPEAVEVSGIGKTKLYDLIAQGKIEAVRVGRRRLVLASSLAAYLEGLRSEAPRSR